MGHIRSLSMVAALLKRWLRTRGPMLEGSRSRQAAADVLEGRDGWLFLHQGAQRQFDYLLGRRPVTPASVRAFWDNVAARAQFCEARGIPYAHVTFPSKPAAMSEWLPDEVRDAVRPLHPTHYAPAAPEALAPLVLYPRDALRALHATEPAYWRTDTHTTPMGTALAMEAAMAALGRPFRVLDHFRRRPTEHIGDLARMLGRVEPEPSVALKGGPKGVERHDNIAVLPGLTGNVGIILSPRAPKGRLVLIGDSFVKPGLRVLTPLWREVIYIRGPGFHEPTLLRLRPDAVLTSCAERYLGHVRPDAEVPDVRTTLATRPGDAPDKEWARAWEGVLGGR